tara:strand:- start:109 stop:408 length:300 start_codon:yes stop_codon:yes gene_type:complete
MRPKNRSKLRTTTKDALMRDRNSSTEVSEKWRTLVDEILENTHLSAEVGEYKYELDMSKHNIATVTRVAEVVREELGDVHVIVRLGKEYKSVTTDWAKA